MGVEHPDGAPASDVVCGALPPRRLRCGLCSWSVNAAGAGAAEAAAIHAAAHVGVPHVLQCPKCDVTHVDRRALLRHISMLHGKAGAAPAMAFAQVPAGVGAAAVAVDGAWGATVVPATCE